MVLHSMKDFERDSQFLTTQWTQILASRGENADSTSEALVALCQNYHEPVLVFIRNQCGDPEKARDLCQGFFERLIETKFYRKARPERGRFRSFLLTAVKNYLLNEHRDASRQKRGAASLHFSIEGDDLAEPELVAGIPPDALFDQQWATTVFKGVWKLLRAEYGQLDQLDRFEAFRPTIMNPGKAFPCAEVAEQLGMSESGAKSAAFRLKSRFRELFREVVAQLVDHPNEVDAELQYLIEAMSFSNR
jgi:RNA polymerase sigma-70 factor (ECF subfamily)